MEKISGIYRITNTITKDFYIGSSKDVKHRWTCHKCQPSWNKYPNNPMYLDMQKYGVENFVFEILAEVESDKLKETEQQFIEMLNPTYNNINVKVLNTERRKKYCRKYTKSNKRTETCRKYNKSDKRKKAQNKYQNQLCFYNGETLTLNALRMRFKRRGISNPTKEAKKYLI